MIVAKNISRTNDSPVRVRYGLSLLTSFDRSTHCCFQKARCLRHPSYSTEARKALSAWEDEPREKEGDVCSLATGTTLATSTVSPLALLPRATFVHGLDNETR